jgi:transposase
LIRRQIASEPVFYFASELGRGELADFYDQIDAAVGDWEALARPVSEVFSRTDGRPTDHVLYVKIFLVGYFQNVVYDTRLAALCADSISIRRFLGLSLVDKVPDHSSLSRVREQFSQGAILEAMLSRVVALCIRAGLVSGRSVHVDTTLIRANASVKNLCALDSDRRVSEYLDEIRKTGTRPAVKNSEFASPSDPGSRIRKKGADKPMMCYSGVHVTDPKSQIIVAARVDYGDSPEVKASLPAVQQAQSRLAQMGESLEVVTADKGYDSQEFHQGVEAMGLQPATFVHAEKSEPGRFSRSDFTFDAERNLYTCPWGKELTLKGFKEGRLAYRARSSDCKHCPFRDVCLGRKGERKELSRMPGEEARERSVAFVKTPEGRRHLKKRASTVEPPFGHMKRFGGLERINCMGIAKAGVKVVMAAIAWNLKKLAKAKFTFAAVQTPTLSGGPLAGKALRLATASR